MVTKTPNICFTYNCLESNFTIFGVLNSQLKMLWKRFQKNIFLIFHVCPSISRKSMPELKSCLHWQIGWRIFCATARWSTAQFMAQNTAQYTTVHRKRRLQHSLDDLNLGNFLRQAAINFQSLPTLLKSPPSSGGFVNSRQWTKTIHWNHNCKNNCVPKIAPTSLICDMSNFVTDGVGD